MGRQAFLAVLCCLTFSESLGEADKTAKSSVTKDNVSEESATRLYRNVPVGVYASAVPYPAVTYKFPAFAAGLLPSASRIIPVKEQLVLHNTNGYLRDSYGNRFVGTPQSGLYKAAIPQQFVQLQELPAHLIKPLTVAAPSYHIKQIAPQITFASQFRIPTLQAATPTYHYAGPTQPVVYSQNIRSIAPTRQSQQLQGPQQQSTSNQAVYSDKHPTEQQYSTYNSEPQFQRLEEKPSISYENVPEDKNNNIKQEIVHEKTQIKASPDTQTYTTIVNGKKTVIELDTNPSVPLLDLTLLEPLQFDDPSPVVPQIAQFLPKINQGTYKNLPEFHKQQKNYKGNKIQGDVEIIKGRPKSKPKKKPKKPVYDDDTTHAKVPVEPSITFKGKPNESPEFSYEINAPNYKETYKEQTVKYNKETSKDPVTYRYDHKEEKDPVSYSYGTTVQKEPVHYNYVHNSKDPGHTKEVQHHINEQPKHLIYTFKPEEQREHEEPNNGPTHPPHPQRESAESSSGEESDYVRHSHPHTKYHENPRESPRHHEHHERSRPAHHEVEHTQRSHGEHHNERNTHTPHHEERPHYAEHAAHQHERPPQSYQPLKVPVQYEQELRPITHQYEEDIKLLPSPSPVIQAELNQHIQKEEQHQHRSPPPHTAHHNGEFVSQQRYPNYPEHQASYGPAPLPLVHEKSKRIIIQEESPDEKHSHSEQMVAEMREQEENNEEDFENAYKNAAFGFPAYHRNPEEEEKNIYNPASYGESREQSFTVDDRPFEQYTAEGDGFPKSARLTYKDTSDNNKEDYFLDYAVNRPTSLRDRYQKKKEYYKLYDSYKPEKYFGVEKKQKENEKYTVAPTFVFATDPEQKKTSFFPQYRAAPPKFTFTFKKPTTHDNSAFATRPYQSYSRKTSFVEPQFQYGFEPIAVPRLLDSELAAMASNDSPESEKPALRKKIYKENWYIKKTSTAGGDAS